MISHSIQNKLQQILHVLEVEHRRRPVILLFGVGSYGDVLQITPLLFALQKKFPGHALVLVHNDPGSQAFFVSDAAPARYVQLNANEHRLLKKLLDERHYDLLVECRYVITYTLPPHSGLSDGARAFVAAAQERQKDWQPYLEKFPFNNDLLWRQAAHQGLNMSGLMAFTAGFEQYDFENLCLPVTPPPLEEIPATLPASYLVASNSAGWLSIQSSLWTKCLAHEKMNAILDRIRMSGIPTVLIGTSNDPGDYHVDIDLRGKTSLLQSAAVIKGASLVLAPEGGVVNMARAVKTKSVVFFGSTPAAFFGFKANVNINPHVCGGCWWTTSTYLGQCPLLKKVPPCTDSIPNETIVEAVERDFHARLVSI
jgi:ADP-heptose:LPS heptosyltransferase